MMAVKVLNVPAARALISAGADPLAKSDAEMTLLHSVFAHNIYSRREVGSKRGHFYRGDVVLEHDKQAEMVGLLLSLGVDVHATATIVRNRPPVAIADGDTPLATAIRSYTLAGSDFTAIDRLIAAGATVHPSAPTHNSTHFDSTEFWCRSVMR
eukprot:m.185877 g.185877  ORF g.185877 m.185877 type:complete len:154 (+) comp15042_c0_seq1:1548-2009(+)